MNLTELEDSPAVVPLFRDLPMDLIRAPELNHMSHTMEWPRGTPPPCLSSDLIKKILAHVNSFTVVGLEAQATAFSCEIWCHQSSCFVTSSELRKYSHRTRMQCNRI